MKRKLGFVVSMAAAMLLVSETQSFAGHHRRGYGCGSCGGGQTACGSCTAAPEASPAPPPAATPPAPAAPAPSASQGQSTTPAVAATSTTLASNYYVSRRGFTRRGWSRW